MNQYPDTLPTTNVPNATPARRMFQSEKVTPANIQVTSTSKSGGLAFLRSQGVSSITLSGQKKSRQ